jgi:hypothetical protein
MSHLGTGRNPVGRCRAQIPPHGYRLRKRINSLSFFEQSLPLLCLVPLKSTPQIASILLGTAFAFTPFTPLRNHQHVPQRHYHQNHSQSAHQRPGCFERRLRFQLSTPSAGVVQSLRSLRRAAHPPHRLPTKFIWEVIGGGSVTAAKPSATTL